MVIELDVTNNIDDCPFCGGRPQRLYGVENDKYWIWCNNSKCLIQPTTPMYKNKGSDIKAWNKRKTID